MQQSIYYELRKQMISMCDLTFAIEALLLLMIALH